MRRLRTKDYEKKQRRRSQRIMGVILIIVMSGSVFGGIVHTLGSRNSPITQNTNSITYYNGFEFIHNNGFWGLEIDNINFVFRNNPNQVEEIDGSLNLINTYHNQPLYIYSENQLATSEISTNIGPLTERMQFACFEGKECDNENLPVKTCDDNFIIIEEKNETSLTQQGGCVFIQGPSQDLVRISDEFLFKILGIRQQ